MIAVVPTCETFSDMEWRDASEVMEDLTLERQQMWREEEENSFAEHAIEALFLWRERRAAKLKAEEEMNEVEVDCLNFGDVALLMDDEECDDQSECSDSEIYESESESEYYGSDSSSDSEFEVDSWTASPSTDTASEVEIDCWVAPTVNPAEIEVDSWVSPVRTPTITRTRVVKKSSASSRAYKAEQAHKKRFLQARALKVRKN
mmetsp:Transcript_15395/g.33086  ORF Transcript_15395/g.33086 Transcript_15395/m.33086 type:complete len:204 (-) Transcript_15395:101-712(-)|eukprot:CAMPEP_0203776432 /NCGR_PEP_ID=MMETSP0099_2-20121227/6737_1 /ASSEMBLY_ACC=CAM_ASM_000209 /TAXON_ID=96639 /ORGANISM=" , Strain NY0313808BC1" /LENGTH=203 /DNA_ID=CAMNT_0050675427 /DNA_START=75 /DNA_END=686 /DNA_ORIENTATION=-